MKNPEIETTENIIDGLISYIHQTDSSNQWSKRKVKDVIRQGKFKELPYASQRKLYIMFDSSQKISSEIIQRELELYIDLLNSNFPISTEFDIFDKFARSIFEEDVFSLSTERLGSILKALQKLNPEKSTPEIDEFIQKIPALYTQNVDNLSNKQLSLLINQIRDMDYKDLPVQMQDFVLELFVRCATKAETSDNNNKKFKTANWFKANPQTFFGQFNKAFFGANPYDEIFIDEPTKKIRFEHLVNYANFQYEFIRQIEELSRVHRLPVSKLLSYGDKYYVYNIASSIATKQHLPQFEPPEQDGSPKKFYLADETREYKSSVLAKSSGLFVSMIREKLEQAYKTQSIDGMADTLSDFAVTQKMKDHLNSLVLASKRYKNFDASYDYFARWLVGLVHIDEIARIPIYEIVKPASAIKQSISQSTTRNEDDGKQITLFNEK